MSRDDPTIQPSILQRLFSLAGKVALVTGASGGIGRVLAEGLAEAGAKVGLHGSTEAKLRPIQRAIEEKGRSALCLPGDLQEVDHCLQLVSEAHERLGRIDVLINCAGVNRRKPTTRQPRGPSGPGAFAGRERGRLFNRPNDQCGWWIIQYELLPGH